jgi:arylformamidase
MAVNEVKVYLEYTQSELDRAYDQRVWAPNAEEVIARYGAESAKARDCFKGVRDVRYGPTEDETLDIFPAAEPGAPVHVHIHGGAWRSLTKDDGSYVANGLVDAGATLAVLNFATIPKVRLPEMVAQASRALGWLYQHAGEFGADASRLHVSGHSSGAHMAAVLLTSDWAAEQGLPEDVIKSALLISGSYDMRPVMLSARSSYVKISEAEIVALSPILHVERVNAPVTMAIGALESPEFKRHSGSFAEALLRAGKTVELLDCGSVNHFEMPELLADPSSAVRRAAVRMMGLG